MPIYEYRCGDCGFQKEFLQKLSDAPLTDCPACGKPALNKLVTAAGFQLKGSGWYVTDFRNGSKAKPADKTEAKAEDKPTANADVKDAKPEAKPAADAKSETPAAKPAPAAAPATSE